MSAAARTSRTWPRGERKRRLRSCQDCKTPLSLGAPDRDYCPSCAPAHTVRCADCRTPFTRDGANTTRCPSCREQLPLFADVAGDPA